MFLSKKALAFSPVLYKLFLLDFRDRGEVPIMSEDNYRMAYTMISVTIVPAASISTFLFRKVSMNIPFPSHFTIVLIFELFKL